MIYPFTTSPSLVSVFIVPLQDKLDYAQQDKLNYVQQYKLD